MVAEHFGLSREPFERCPDLDDRCLPNTLAALLAELQAALRSPQGVSVLVAPSGSGKSLIAATLERRLGEQAHVALISQPFSSVSAIAREVLAKVDAAALAYVADGDWVRALRASISRRADAGHATVLLLDDAQRLSPQTLQALPALFAADDSLRLHLFLFGSPALLDRMDCSAERGLSAHLLQICRLESLGVRESVRYLERRVSLCGGNLAEIFGEDAIEELVQSADGRVLRLERLAAGAMDVAVARGAGRVSAQDAKSASATLPLEIEEEEEGSMASRQQSLRFEIRDRVLKEEVDDWVAGEDSESEEAWSDDDDEDTESVWESDSEGDEEDEEESLAWESAEQDEDDDDFVPAPHVVAAAPEASRKMAGPAVLTLAACLGLVWAANQIPDSNGSGGHGRDSMLTTRPLSETPESILRVAGTAEAADASAHVVAWGAQPPRPATQVAAAGSGDILGERSSPPASAKAGTMAPAAAIVASAQPAAQPVAVAKTREAAKPAAQRPTEKVVSMGSSVVAKAPAKSVSKSAPVASAAASPRPASRAVSAKSGGSVFTVQLGAFKAKQNAEVMVKKLSGKSARILREGGLYRVVSGSFSNKQEAALHEASLQRAGYSTYVRTAVF